MSALPAPAAPNLIELPTAPNTVTVLMWLPAARTLSIAVMRVRATRGLPRTLMSATVRADDLAHGAEADAHTLSLGLPGVTLGLTTPHNLRGACEWLDRHGVCVRAATA